MNQPVNYRRYFALAAILLCIGTIVSAKLLAADTPGATSTENTLTDAEKAAGWKLLFDGKSLDGWRGYKRNSPGAGWKVLDGTLACVDPRSAGDLITTEKFGPFELTLEYNISQNGNSGVIFHSTEEGSTSWSTGPEVQLFDNSQPEGHESQLSGWLYQMYKPTDDAKTGKPVDATKPAGQWNLLRLLITPEKCEVDMNGTKYYEFVIGSDDWKQRVGKSKFASMGGYGKAESGHLVLQGDHGQVSFRNIKIRPIK